MFMIRIRSRASHVRMSIPPIEIEISGTIKARKLGFGMQILGVLAQQGTTTANAHNAKVYNMLYQYASAFQKLYKSDHPFKSYRRMKCAIPETADLLHAYLHLPRTPLS